MTVALRFKNHAAYQKWLAFGHIHHKFNPSAPNPRIFITGKIHRVKH